jgi:ribosomal protein S15P/S13E
MCYYSNIMNALPIPTPDTAAPAVDRGALARMVMTLLGHWNLATEDQAALLGLSEGNRAALARYRKGEPIGTNRDQYERVGHLLGIHKNLRLLFPENRELAYRWMSVRNRAFANRSPVEVIREHGFVGLLMVRAYLDRARGH